MSQAAAPVGLPSPDLRSLRRADPQSELGARVLKAVIKAGVQKHQDAMRDKVGKPSRGQARDHRIGGWGARVVHLTPVKCRSARDGASPARLHYAVIAMSPRTFGTRGRGVYRFSGEDGRSYVGRSERVENRLSQHTRSMRGGLAKSGPGAIVQAAKGGAGLRWQARTVEGTTGQQALEEVLDICEARRMNFRANTNGRLIALQDQEPLKTHLENNGADRQRLEREIKALDNEDPFRAEGLRFIESLAQ